MCFDWWRVGGGTNASQQDAGAIGIIFMAVPLRPYSKGVPEVLEPARSSVTGFRGAVLKTFDSLGV